MTAVDTKSGDELWRVDLAGETVNLSDRFWSSGEVLVIPSFSGNVIALDGGTGKELWRYEPTFPQLGNVTVEGGRVWFVLHDRVNISKLQDP